NSGALFRALARALWARERQRGMHQLPFEPVESAFARLAYTLIDEDLPLDIPVEKATQQLGNEKLILLGVNANFLVQSGDQVRFYPHLILEFFAAVELNLRQIPSLFGPSAISYSETLLNQLWEKWRQIVIALCGIATNPDEILKHLTTVSPLFAKQCIDL